jgi:hypothetical protein
VCRKRRLSALVPPTRPRDRAQARLDPLTVARMAGDKVETIMSTYAHEFARARSRDDLRAKLEAKTEIRERAAGRSRPG